MGSCSKTKRMRSNGNYNLVWKDAVSSTVNSFKSFLQSEEYSDVTLVCEDGRPFFLNLHKLILGGGSEFFRNIFANTKSQQYPLLVLDNNKPDCLQSLIDFIYFGETNVMQEMLPAFLSAAQRFKIKGLTEEIRQHQSSQSTRQTLKDTLVFKEENEEVIKENIIGALVSNDTITKLE